MKTVLIGIARMGSTRLPGKVLMPLGGFPVIQWVVEAGAAAPGVDEVWVATSTLKADDVIAAWCEIYGIKCFRGDENDVLSRFTGAAIAAKATVAVRVTCDCPFLDSGVIGEVVALRAATNADYASNIDPPTWPDGLDCEAMTVKALKEANEKATRPSDRNTVTRYLTRNRLRYKAANLTCPIPGLHKERWVLDTEDDYEFCKRIADNVEGKSYLHILKWLNGHPDVREINAHHPRNERFWDELVKDEPMERPHTFSHSMLGLAEKVIPLGAQTFSKSKLQYPVNAPLFVTHGSGGHVYDVDGNDYVDLVGGLLPVILGYRDPDVDQAIRDQLDRGISFSVATELETSLAERLKRFIPCAQMTRFGKNGTDVTSAAIRLARHATGRNMILSSGYHGWSDWAVAQDPVRNKGVPESTRDLTTMLRYGEIKAAQNELETQKYACVIVEPETDPDFLRKLRGMCNYTETILIFDEIITGFRFGLGGAQELYGVKPDLACFGKAMGNGMPISALVGKRDLMQQMNEICYSGTFFGEALSLAASIAVIDKMAREPVLDKLLAHNRAVATFVPALQDEHGDCGIRVKGTHLSRLHFLTMGRHQSQDIKTLFMQEMIKNGVLIIASHNFMYAHNEADIQRIVNAYDRTFGVMAKALKEDRVRESIIGPSIDATANVRVLA